MLKCDIESTNFANFELVVHNSDDVNAYFQTLQTRYDAQEDKKNIGQYLIQQHSFFHLVDRVELFINLSDCQIVRFRHIGGGWAAAAGRGRR